MLYYVILCAGKMLWKEGRSIDCDMLLEPMAKMRYSEMPRDVSCDSLSTLRISEVSVNVCIIIEYHGLMHSCTVELLLINLHNCRAVTKFLLHSMDVLLYELSWMFLLLSLQPLQSKLAKLISSLEKMYINQIHDTAVLKNYSWLEWLLLLAIL